jgi:hypothetical protein
MSIKDAFFAIATATVAESHYVTLYVDRPFYGGPEEGGWWGRDTEMVAYQEVPTEEQAQALRDKVDVLAEQLSKVAKIEFGKRCQAECEWLEARGLDADWLPEVNGEDRYWVTTEKELGSMVSEGDRSYS